MPPNSKSGVVLVAITHDPLHLSNILQSCRSVAGNSFSKAAPAVQETSNLRLSIVRRSSDGGRYVRVEFSTKPPATCTTSRAC